jgi:peptidoglycan/LPS O-acetylase OafA/YrhL
MPELDALRGVAILGVVIHHGIYMRTLGTALPRWQALLVDLGWMGRLGVNLFFVLSGFLITGLLLDSGLRSDYYRRFYIRRVLRIFPIYFIILAVLAALHYPPFFLVLSVLYLSNVAPFFGLGIAYNILWSLAVEEHFYILWPAIVRNVSQIVLLWISILIILVSPLVRLISFDLASPADMNWTFYTWNNADGLACGAFLALFVRLTNQSRRSLWQACRVACVLAIAIWSIGLPFRILSRHYPMGAALQVVPWQFLFFAIMGSSLLIGTTKHRAMVHSKILMFFGYISYGLYLIHPLALDAFDSIARHMHVPGLGHSFWGDVLVRFVYAATAATILAWFSRKFFEAPFLRLKNRLS